jgi:hypothetical protein
MLVCDKQIDEKNAIFPSSPKVKPPNKARRFSFVRKGGVMQIHCIAVDYPFPSSFAGCTNPAVSNRPRTPMTESPHNAGATITVAHSQRDGAYCADEQPDAAHKRPFRHTKSSDMLHSKRFQIQIHSSCLLLLILFR